MRAKKLLIRPLLVFAFAGFLSSSIGCGSTAPNESEHSSDDLIVKCGKQPRPTKNESAIKFSLKTHRDGDQPIEIVTTIGMVTDIVRQVAGKHANVTGLMREGVDPHLYQPTLSDIEKLRAADVIFYSGLKLETGRMQSVFEQQHRDGKPVFAVTDVLSKDYLHNPPEFEGHFDPHVWGDVDAWSLCVDYVANALSAFDEKHADDYRKNADEYRETLNKLTDYAQKSLQSVPEEKRVLITAHDAFGYFSCAYGIPVKSAQGISTESEAGVNDVNRLVNLIVTRKIAAIFIESSVNEKNMLAIVEGAKSQEHQVSIGGELYSDAMGPAGTYEGTYVGMMDHNITTITRALGGTAPKDGCFGKLTKSSAGQNR